MFKKMSLELGGKNATIVMDDVDLEKIIAGVTRASFLNSGQICLCGSRIFVANAIYDRFEARFVEEVNKMTVGDSTTADMGSLISFAHRDKVESYIELAKREGGQISTGGTRPDLPG